MNAPIIIPNGCKNCHHQSVQNRQMVCTLSPPQSSLVMSYVERTVDGGKILEPQIRGFVSAFPSVEPDMKCSHHKRALVSAGLSDRLKAQI